MMIFFFFYCDFLLYKIFRVFLFLSAKKKDGSSIRRWIVRRGVTAGGFPCCGSTSFILLSSHYHYICDGLSSSLLCLLDHFMCIILACSIVGFLWQLERGCLMCARSVSI